jgi:periplasmic divalent cation tolerance protein
MDEFAIVITTSDSDELTRQIADRLLKDRLAACIQVQEIRSFYRWGGRVQNDAEQLILIKSRSADYEKIEAALAEVHTYDEPEIVQVPITAGSDGYLAWIISETAS